MNGALGGLFNPGGYRMDGAYEPEQVQVQAVSLSFESLMEGLAGSKT